MSASRYNNSVNSKRSDNAEIMNWRDEIASLQWQVRSIYTKRYSHIPFHCASSRSRRRAAAHESRSLGSSYCFAWTQNADKSRLRIVRPRCSNGISAKNFPRCRSLVVNFRARFWVEDGNRSEIEVESMDFEFARGHSFYRRRLRGCRRQVLCRRTSVKHLFYVKFALDLELQTNC